MNDDDDTTAAERADEPAPLDAPREEAPPAEPTIASDEEPTDEALVDEGATSAQGAQSSEPDTVANEEREPTEPGTPTEHAGQPLPVADKDKPEHEPMPKVFWPALVIGWGVITVGILGVLQKMHHFAGRVPWRDVTRWTVGLAVVHDLIVAPTVCIIGLVLSRVLPERLRAPIQAGLIVSALVTITAWPVYRVGVPLADNPSILPGNYGRGLLLVLAVIWFVTIGFVVRGVLASRRDEVAA